MKSVAWKVLLSIGLLLIGLGLLEMWTSQPRTYRGLKVGLAIGMPMIAGAIAIRRMLKNQPPNSS